MCWNCSDRIKIPFQYRKICLEIPSLQAGFSLETQRYLSGLLLCVGFSVQTFEALGGPLPLSHLELIFKAISREEASLMDLGPRPE